VARAAWPAAEWISRGKPSVLGFCSGAVGGLAVITPCAGFVTASGAVIIGVLAGIVPFFACTKLKHALGYDDALDTFGVHAIGGTMGSLPVDSVQRAGLHSGSFSLRSDAHVLECAPWQVLGSQAFGPRESLAKTPNWAGGCFCRRGFVGV